MPPPQGMTPQARGAPCPEARALRCSGVERSADPQAGGPASASSDPTALGLSGPEASTLARRVRELREQRRRLQLRLLVLDMAIADQRAALRDLEDRIADERAWWRREEEADL